MSLLVKKRLNFIDMIINSHFKGISSAMDGLNKFFKIINKYRRGQFYVSYNMHDVIEETNFLGK